MRAEEDPKLLARLPLALKTFYDADVLEEDAILAWGAGATGKARTAAQPLLTWLAEAEEDDDDDDEQ